MGGGNLFLKPGSAPDPDRVLLLAFKEAICRDTASASTRTLNMCSRDGSRDVPMACSCGRKSRCRDIKDLPKPFIGICEVCLFSMVGAPVLRRKQPWYTFQDDKVAFACAVLRERVIIHTSIAALRRCFIGELRYSSYSLRKKNAAGGTDAEKSKGKPYSAYSSFFSLCGSVAYKVVCPHLVQVNACNATVEKSVRTKLTPSLQGAITRSPPHSGQGVRGGNRLSLSILLSPDFLSRALPLGS